MLATAAHAYASDKHNNVLLHIHIETNRFLPIEMGLYKSAILIITF